MRRHSGLLALSFLLLLPACDETGRDAGPYCTENKTLIANLDAPLPDGSTARSALGSALGLHALRFEHEAHQNAVTTFSPNSNGVKGSVELRYNAGAIYYVDAKPKKVSSGLALDQSCPNRVEIDVNVAFKSDDGAFAENWNATLVQVEGHFDQLQPGEQKLTELTISLDENPVTGGSFKIDPPPAFPPEKLERRILNLNLRWNPKSFRGGTLGGSWIGKSTSSPDGTTNAMMGRLEIYTTHPDTVTW